MVLIFASIGVALSILLSSIGIAAATPVVVKKPPYVGAAVYNHFVGRTTSGCNSHASVTVPGTFNITSGVARIAVKATTQMCQRSAVSASLSGDVGVTDVGFRVPSSGGYSAAAYWSVHAGVNISVFFKGNTSLSMLGTAHLRPVLCVKDTTTGGSFGCTAAHWFGAVSSSTNTSSNITSSFAEILGISLTAGHSYDFRTFVEYDLTVGVGSPAGVGSHMSVTLDMSSSNFNATLKSLTVA